MADLNEMQSEILKMKCDKVKNPDIASYINKKYKKNYTANYISTIFRQKIIKQINEAAEYHLRLGTIYFRIDKDETEISLEKEIGGRVQRLGFDEDYLLCARYTPSYYQELWESKVLETLEIEYNWRKKV